MLEIWWGSRGRERNGEREKENCLTWFYAALSLEDQEEAELFGVLKKEYLFSAGEFTQCQYVPFNTQTLCSY